jgi:hypothetical protein
MDTTSIQDTVVQVSGLRTTRTAARGVGIAAYVLRSPGYWVPAAQVADGLAVLPLDGVFE